LMLEGRFDEIIGSNT